LTVQISHHQVGAGYTGRIKRERIKNYKNIIAKKNNRVKINK